MHIYTRTCKQRLHDILHMCVRVNEFVYALHMCVRVNVFVYILHMCFTHSMISCICVFARVFEYVCKCACVCLCVYVYS